MTEKSDLNHGLDELSHALGINNHADSYKVPILTRAKSSIEYLITNKLRKGPSKILIETNRWYRGRKVWAWPEYSRRFLESGWNGIRRALEEEDADEERTDEPLTRAPTPEPEQQQQGQQQGQQQRQRQRRRDGSMPEERWSGSSCLRSQPTTSYNQATAGVSLSNSIDSDSGDNDSIFSYSTPCPHPRNSRHDSTTPSITSESHSSSTSSSESTCRPRKEIQLSHPATMSEIIRSEISSALQPMQRKIRAQTGLFKTIGQWKAQVDKERNHVSFPQAPTHEPEPKPEPEPESESESGVWMPDTPAEDPSWNGAPIPCKCGANPNDIRARYPDIPKSAVWLEVDPHQGRRHRPSASKPPSPATYAIPATAVASLNRSHAFFSESYKFSNIEKVCHLLASAAVAADDEGDASEWMAGAKLAGARKLQFAEEACRLAVDEIGDRDGGEGGGQVTMPRILGKLLGAGP
ncbi:hypothetical protein ACHAQI_010879 [Fusarium lateritium]